MDTALQYLAQAAKLGAWGTTLVVLYLWIRDRTRDRDYWREKYMELEEELRKSQEREIEVLEEMWNTLRSRLEDDSYHNDDVPHDVQ